MKKNKKKKKKAILWMCSLLNLLSMILCEGLHLIIVEYKHRTFKVNSAWNIFEKILFLFFLFIIKLGDNEWFCLRAQTKLVVKYSGYQIQILCFCNLLRHICNRSVCPAPESNAFTIRRFSISKYHNKFLCLIGNRGNLDFRLYEMQFGFGEGEFSAIEHKNFFFFKR